MIEFILCPAIVREPLAALTISKIQYHNLDDKSLKHYINTMLSKVKANISVLVSAGDIIINGSEQAKRSEYIEVNFDKDVVVITYGKLSSNYELIDCSHLI